MHTLFFEEGAYAISTVSFSTMVAEQNAAFIFYLFEERWGSTGSEITTSNIKQAGGYDRGVYLFYLQKATDEEKRYPIYVGITSRNFSTRFKEHAGNGVIDKVLVSKTFKPSGGPYKLYYHTCSFEPVAAKVVESIFLHAFDFAFNTDENGSARAELILIPQNKPEDTFGSFKDSFQSIMSGISDISNKYFSGMNLEPSK